jgi:hypothetical protein
MKKQQIVILFLILLFLALLYFMGSDLFTGGAVSQENPAEYNIDKYRIVDSSKICYEEIMQIPVNLEEINGLAVDKNSDVYLTGDKEVQIYDSGFKLQAGFKLENSANCIALSSAQKILLGIGDHVEVYNRDGKVSASWSSFNSDGYITSIVQIGEYIYVADAGNKVVLKYDQSGNLQSEIGRKDTIHGINGFILPSLYLDVATGPGEDLWVNNTGRHLLQNFSEDGKLNTSWGEPSIMLEGFAGCCNPVHFAILPDGCFVTYEKGMDRVKIYDRTGAFVCVVTAPTAIDESGLTNCNNGAKVHDLAVTQKGNILVLDANLKMIRVFQKR